MMIIVGAAKFKTEYHRHALAAIHAINESLRDPIRRYSDGVIAGITLLAAVEVSRAL
jgi:hypothetical protein